MRQEGAWNVHVHSIGAGSLKLPLPWNKPKICGANLGSPWSLKPASFKSNLHHFHPPNLKISKLSQHWLMHSSHPTDIGQVNTYALRDLWLISLLFSEKLLGPMGDTLVYSFKIDFSSSYTRFNLCLPCSHDTQDPGVSVFPSRYLTWDLISEDGTPHSLINYLYSFSMISQSFQKRPDFRWS